MSFLVLLKNIYIYVLFKSQIRPYLAYGKKSRWQVSEKEIAFKLACKLSYFLVTLLVFFQFQVLNLLQAPCLLDT